MSNVRYNFGFYFYLIVKISSWFLAWANPRSSECFQSWWNAVCCDQRCRQHRRKRLPGLWEKVRRRHEAMNQALSLGHLQSIKQKNKRSLNHVLPKEVLKRKLFKGYLAVICFFHFVLLFWNQVLIWTSVRRRVFDNSSRFETDKYLSALQQA